MLSITGRYADGWFPTFAPDPSLLHGQLFTHDLRLPGNANGFWESEENGYRVLSHAGDLNTSHALLALVSEQDLGFYVAYNSHGDAIEARSELWEVFVSHVLPPSNAPSPAVAEGSHESVEHLAGSYGVNRVSTTTLSKLLKLISVVTVATEAKASSPTSPEERTSAGSRSGETSS